MKGGNMVVTYICKGCGRTIEQFTDISNYPAPKKCEGCKGKDFTRKGNTNEEVTE